MQGNTFHIITYGCQMNEYDSAAVETLLRAAGWQPGPLDDASLLIINSCAVRQRAENKALGRLISLARARPERTCGLIGCVAQERGREILDGHPEVDFAIGPGEIDRITEIVSGDSCRKAFLDVDRLSGAGLRAHMKPGAMKAFVAISRGCDNFCSYCIVPYVRGKLRGRPMDDILSEIESVVRAGVREVTLIGQNVNSYRDPATGEDFADLLRRISAVENLCRIRFVTNHPKDMGEKTIGAIAELPGVCEAIHLPVQSGSTRILRAMNRGYTRDDYLELVDTIRAEIPGATLTTDIITGFPGESEGDFAETVSLFKTVGYAGAFAFRYSARPGTAATGLDDDVPENEKIRRLEIMISLIQESAGDYSRSLIGTVREVLVEGESAKNPGMMFGFDRGGRRVIFPGDNSLRGRLVNVIIADAERWLLRGSNIVT